MTQFARGLDTALLTITQLPAFTANSTASLRRAALLTLLCLGLCGCGGGSAATLPSGRMVCASSDTLWMSQANAQDTATLSLGPTTVIVGPTQVTINGKPVVTLSPQVKAVDVKRANRRVSIVADGTKVYDAPLAK